MRRMYSWAKYLHC